MVTQPLILASASPRRRQLLEQIGVVYDVMPVNIDETVRESEPALAYTRRLAQAKALICATQSDPQRLVLAADTAVCIDEVILGKPRDKAHGLQMLAQLSGRVHRVVTSFALRTQAHSICVSCHTDVQMATIGTAHRKAYWNSGEPRDKAGGYAIQGYGAAFVERIEGSYSNVVGLPLFELIQALRDFGVELFGNPFVSESEKHDPKAGDERRITD